MLASVAMAATKSDRSCVVQCERGAVPTRLGGDLVPSEEASSVSDSEQLLLAACVACVMASQDDPFRGVRARLISEDVRME